ncbi:MFS transporter [Asinibacterium sp. OR53]|uniref:MFS transporter n=1 Tax=Asinibacterium sp. OR53 TaxID=925409 RepID=UPI00047A47F9|nr:MFS transporter [Asinibacterium sp. OR53]
MKIITRTVWILSLVSLLTDIASEMLYPVMPLYLKSIGFSIVLIGMLEGVAEAIAGLSKGYFGRLSDHKGLRMPFVQGGYALSALSKPMMALLIAPVWIFFARTIDRLGKGLRTGARDAVLSDEATPATKGKIFGFHRSMDTVGAVIGPLLALAYLQWHPGEYKPLFIIAFAPGLLAVLCSLLLKDKKSIGHRGEMAFFSFLHYWKISPVLYKRLVIGLLVFALANSSDVFLLLKIRQSGMNDSEVITVYIFYNLIFAVCAFPIGILGDKVGLKKMFLIGLFLFVVVYSGMGFSRSRFIFYGLFFLYGVYAAATEGISKAWISNIASQKDTATAIGVYSGFQSICTMLASALAGYLWFQYGAMATFLVSAMAAGIVLIYFFLFIPAPDIGQS